MGGEKCSIIPITLLKRPLVANISTLFCPLIKDYQLNFAAVPPSASQPSPFSGQNPIDGFLLLHLKSDQHRFDGVAGQVLHKRHKLSSHCASKAFVGGHGGLGKGYLKA